MLDVGIGLTHKHLFNLKPGRTQILSHFFGAKEKEVNANRLLPPRIEMNRLLTKMKRRQQQPTRLEHSLQLAEARTKSSRAT